MAPFYLGQFSRSIQPSDIIHIASPSQTQTLRNGDIVEILDRIFEWDDDCVTADTLESWRSRGDDMCDAALDFMFPSPFSSAGVDLLAALESKTSGEDEMAGPACSFLQAARVAIPASIAAPSDQILRAQAFFWSNTVPIMTSLLHFSLAGGFASPRISRVLNLSSYLIPPSAKAGKPVDEAITKSSNDRTFGRLSETGQFMLEVMGAPPPTLVHSPASSLAGTANEKAYEHCMLPDAEGWKSSVRVRMLHATVRRRILSRAAQNGEYEVSRDGLPVNQEDLAATLASFSVAPLNCMKDMGWRVTQQEAEDYIALWRVIGYHLGVAPDILESHFMNYNQAGKFLASCVIHLLDFTHPEPDAPPPPTIPILKAISERPPFRTSFASHMALTRFLLGPKLSDHLGVAETSLYQVVRLRLNLFVSHYPKRFGELYPRKAWERRRVALMKEGVRRLTRFNLGLRRTVYRPRDADKPDLDPRVREAETVVPDFEGGKRMMREYRLMMLEMGGVTLTCGLLACAGVWALAARVLL
ncbi:hypothetical protein CALVIDRAFT_522046 [Calocera viscosa TUFC12733]|uniref:ER-bound oxygenase mpaB/mpaB'/Rubber oxygenase catalytic domain-containing protein n=1 Tax=Calocera viscosa (strain TUFC12733) TaxID=1330018 RepID=A0A167GYY7_CALVF|nr:hypothetical protein CALVIDRAFT_522046 [Calocera viscosa TUFC12733]